MDLNDGGTLSSDEIGGGIESSDEMDINGGGTESPDKLKCENCHLVLPNQEAKKRHMKCKHCRQTCITIQTHKYCPACETCYNKVIFAQSCTFLLLDYKLFSNINAGPQGLF